MRALHTAATGMMAQELNVQVISNNIANMRTTGYKRQRAEFQDLLYEHVTPHRHADLDAGQHPAGRHRPRRRRQDRRHAAPDDAGHARADRQRPRRRHPRRRLLQDPDAGRHLRLHPRRLVPDGRAGPHRHRRRATSCSPASPSRRTRRRSPSTRRARSRRRSPGSTTPTVLGQITLTRFVNKAGLQPIGDNLFVETPASGTPQDGMPNTDGYRRPAAGQSRTGQRRGGDRDLRPDRRAARLRDERQGHHRRRPDAVGHLQPDALRNGHDPHRPRSRLLLALGRGAGAELAAVPPPPPLKELVTVTRRDRAHRRPRRERRRRRRHRRSSARPTSARPAPCRSRASPRRCAPYDMIGLDTRGLSEVVVTRRAARITAQGHRGAHRARARRAIRPRRRAEPRRHLRPRRAHAACRADRDGRARGRAPELRAAHRPLRRRLRAARQRAGAARCRCASPARVDRDRRDRDADRARSRAARSSRRPTSRSSAGRRPNSRGDGIAADQAIGLAAQARAARRPGAAHGRPDEAASSCSATRP